MKQGISAIVYPVKDLAKAKAIYSKFLGVEPYADAPFYVGYRVGEHEVGLDPNGFKTSSGPIAYTDVADIKASLKTLLDAGAQLVQDPTDVGGGLLIAQVKDADGSVIGLRQGR